MYNENLTDEKLTILLSRGDKNAFEQIYGRYHRKLLSMAVYKTNDRAVAEELVQELFVSLWEKRSAANIQNLENYLFVSLKYLVISYLRKTIAERKLVGTEGLELGNYPTETLTAEALQQAIYQAVEQLSDKTKMVFQMSRYEEKSHREIAAFLKISEKAVEYHITQALKFLRAELHEFLL